MKKKIILGILIIVWLSFIWGHSMQVAEVSDAESGVFLDFFSKYLPFIPYNDDGMFLVRKAAHFTEYGVLGVLISLEVSCFVTESFRRFIESVGMVLSAAFVDETIQLFVEGRSGQVSDMWVDLAGATLGILLTIIFQSWFRSGRRQHCQHRKA